MSKTYVIAKSDRWFWSWCRENNLNRNRDIIYLHDIYQLRGITDAIVVLVGHYWDGPFFSQHGAVDELRALEHMGRVRVLQDYNYLNFVSDSHQNENTKNSGKSTT